MLGASWIVRALFVAAIGDAHSQDVDHWLGALAAQDEGRNPYELGVLNWPPLWLVVIVTVDYASNLVDLAFWSGLRIYLVLVESVLIVTLYATLLSAGAERAAARRALLVGIALNPVAIILVCQHGNSDAQVGLLVTLTVAALAAYGRSLDVVMWLFGCLFLGLGVLAKTAPLVLSPLLAPGARRVSRAAASLGAALFLGPAALGLAIIAVLEPNAVWDHVIAYRSTRGFFGLSGMVEEFAVFDVRTTIVSLVAVGVLVGLWLLLRARRQSVGAAVLLASTAVVVVTLWLTETLDRLTDLEARDRYSTAFTVALVVAVAWLFHRLWGEKPPDAPRLFLLVAVTFMAVVAFGPGYGAQYAYWFLPALVGTYVLLDDGWRRMLQIAWVVSALTYTIEYAVVPFLGAWAVAMFGSPEWLTDFADYLATPHHWVIFRLPLFAVYLILIGAGIERLVQRAAPATATA